MSMAEQAAAGSHCQDRVWEGEWQSYPGKVLSEDIMGSQCPQQWSQSQAGPRGLVHTDADATEW